jgi:hypothetical protein
MCITYLNALTNNKQWSAIPENLSKVLLRVYSGTANIKQTAASPSLSSRTHEKGDWGDSLSSGDIAGSL